jgi:hypothetical protein
MLLDRSERLTPADHQTHRHYIFSVPEGCTCLTVHVRYTPKFLSAADSRKLVEASVQAQSASLTRQLGGDLGERWAADFEDADLIVPNLLTIALDDATGAYRGAGHRHAEDQHLRLGVDSASPGLIAGPIPAGLWTLTLSAHTIVSDQCEVEIQIGAETATSAPAPSRSSA